MVPDIHCSHFAGPPLETAGRARLPVPLAIDLLESLGKGGMGVPNGHPPNMHHMFRATMIIRGFRYGLISLFSNNHRDGKWNFLADQLHFLDL
jgi:hypothetical protein